MQVVSIPQIIAALSILPQEWSDNTGCDEDHIARWYWWAGASAFRMLLYCIVVSIVVLGREWLEARPRYQVQAMNMKHIIDATGYVT